MEATQTTTMQSTEKTGQAAEKYKLAYSEKLGRYFVAAKDFTAGEVILRESVKVVGPGAFNKSFMCFDCLRLLPDVEESKRLYSCSSCNVAIFCSTSCQNRKIHHTNDECAAFRGKARLTSLDALPMVMQVLLPLRVWLLQKANDRSLWDRVLSMEAHVEERRGTPIWNNREVNVIEVLRNLELVSKQEERNSEPELLQRLCGILDVNSFELRPPGGTEDSPLRGLFPDVAIIAHHCIRNTHITVDNRFELTVYASVPIKRGETILVNYTSPLLGSDERREHLRQGKYFECDCSRCSDPRELDSDLSSLVCPRCKIGWVTNRNPLRVDVYSDNESWQCDNCKSSISGKLVRTTLVLTKNLIAQTDIAIQSMEELLNKLLRSFHKNHFFVVSVKQRIHELYKKECACLNPEKTMMEKLLETGRAVVSILEIVEPGISRPKGILLWEMHLPMVLLADRDYTDGKIGAQELVERLEDAESCLKRSLTMLLLEPPDTPEGFLARQALQDFKSLRETLTQAKLLNASIKTYAARTNKNNQQRKKK